MLLVQTRLEYGLSANRMSILGGAPKPYFVVRGDELVLENEPVPQAAAKSSDIGWARSIFGHSYLVHYAMTRLDLLQWWVAQAMGTKYVLSNAESVDVTCLLMRRLAGLRDRYSIPISLVLQYSAVDGTTATIPSEADRARVIGCAEQEKLEIVDTLPSLQSVYRAEGAESYKRLWVMSDNDRVFGHMSAEGNRLVADQIFQHLPSQLRGAAAPDLATASGR